ncbi:MAG: type 1 glutamine amidotransferase domain-containing protein [Nitrosomonas sp.]|uniref:type 1 glutamine amidotransferase domain-containing protein n=1 Tax=Nitrosomonas sp. TaxID=42353 RepID=UPI0025647898|nr:type 1 glutamine amidotransferase domain-containing protein [Nitrosomonas sp.]MCC6923445.1 type 1 glutamine amidotransferase domain-containing protein [Nitrosomonas sp.]MDL1866408.1 type 1 glutamine amidotransferase domain-containing protein [Betaproteobacteria bacterium PRO4]
MTRKILVVLTSVEKYPDMDRATGLWLGEAVHFVKKVEAAGYEVDYVSPKGGYTPIDPHSLSMAEPVDWEWYQDKDFMNRLGKTSKASEVNPDDYVAIYYAGGHGVVWDFPDNAELQSISRKIYENGGVVSSVCHGAAGLLNITLSNGSLLVKGKQLTGFSNEEEKLAELDKFVPFLTETELVARGAIYKKAEEPWVSFAVEDQRLITGQNPASGEAVADLLIKALGK